MRRVQNRVPYSAIHCLWYQCMEREREERARRRAWRSEKILPYHEYFSMKMIRN